MLRAILSVFFLTTISMQAMQKSLTQPLLATAFPVAGGSKEGSPVLASQSPSKLTINAQLPVAGGSQKVSPVLVSSAGSSKSGSPATGSPAFASAGAGVAVPALADASAKKLSGLDKLLVASHTYVKRPKFGAKLLRWKQKAAEQSLAELHAQYPAPLKQLDS